jgi:hypothetical protein
MASAPAPSAPVFPLWSCTNSDLEQPITMKLWPPFAAGKASKFGTALWMVILTVVLLLIMGFILARSKTQTAEGGVSGVTKTGGQAGILATLKEPSTLKGMLAMLMVLLAGMSATWGFALWGLKYTNPEMDRDPPADGFEAPGLLDAGKVPEGMVPPVCTTYDGFLLSPLMYVVIVPAVAIMLAVFLMIKRYTTTATKTTAA